MKRTLVLLAIAAAGTAGNVARAKVVTTDAASVGFAAPTSEAEYGGGASGWYAAYPTPPYGPSAGE